MEKYYLKMLKVEQEKKLRLSKNGLFKKFLSNQKLFNIDNLNENLYEDELIIEKLKKWNNNNFKDKSQKRYKLGKFQKKFMKSKKNKKKIDYEEYKVDLGEIQDKFNKVIKKQINFRNRVRLFSLIN